MFHCFGMNHNSILKFMGARVGWVGVDLFFVLSGYLIANQIFSAFINQGQFSLKTFYFRRFLRTLPNYIFVLGLYFMIPIFSEQPLRGCSPEPSKFPDKYLLKRYYFKLLEFF